MDHGDLNRRFVDALLAFGELNGDVLDLGTGTAQIPIELCQQNADCRVMAVDAAVAMLDVARVNLEIAGLTMRVQLDRADAKDLPYEDEMFGAVMSNSIVHHIPEPASVLSEAVRVLGPGGTLFFRDLLRPQSDGDLQTLVETYAAGESDHARQMFSDSLRAALTLDEMRELASAVGIPPDAFTQTSDRHWPLASMKSA